MSAHRRPSDASTLRFCIWITLSGIGVALCFFGPRTVVPLSLILIGLGQWAASGPSQPDNSLKPIPFVVACVVVSIVLVAMLLMALQGPDSGRTLSVPVGADLWLKVGMALIWAAYVVLEVLRHRSRREIRLGLEQP